MPQRSINLLDLEPEFLKFVGADSFQQVGTLEEAQGVMFDEPFTENPSRVVCWFKNRNVPMGAIPGPGRWDVSGTGFHDLTLSPSVDLSCANKYPGRWHGWIKNGVVT